MTSWRRRVGLRLGAMGRRAAARILTRRTRARVCRSGGRGKRVMPRKAAPARAARADDRRRSVEDNSDQTRGTDAVQCSLLSAYLSNGTAPATPALTQ